MHSREALRRRRQMTLRGRLTVVLGLLVIASGIAAAVPTEEATPSQPQPVRVEAPAEPLVPLSLPTAMLAPPASRADQQGLVQVDGQLERALALPAAPDSRLRYTLDAELTQAVWEVLERGHVGLGHVIVMDPRSGAVLAYVSTDSERFPATRAYPAASLVKVITAAAALDLAPEVAWESCRYNGSPYRLSQRAIDPPRTGTAVSMRKALAMSNNQCFAQYAVHRVGRQPLLEAIDRFGMLQPPARAHTAGSAVDPGADRYALGELGCGLAGLSITPLHAVQLAATLASGLRVEPFWIERAWSERAGEIPLAGPMGAQRVIDPMLAGTLREMLTETTRRGTARRAFRTPRGTPLLQGIEVAGKTGSLSGKNPDGRYEWFAGVAPASDPRIAVAAVVVQGPRWWVNGSAVAAQVLRAAFCPNGTCSVANADRLLPSSGRAYAGRQHRASPGSAR